MRFCMKKCSMFSSYLFSRHVSQEAAVSYISPLQLETSKKWAEVLLEWKEADSYRLSELQEGP